MTTLREARGLEEPLKSYNYEFFVPNVPGGGSSQELLIRATELDIPGFESETIEDTFPGGHVIKHVGRGMYPRTLGVSFKEGANTPIYSILEAWHALQWDRTTGVQSTPSVYKTDGSVRVYDSGKNVVKTWNMLGMFVEAVEDTSMSSDNSELVIVNATFSYDTLTVA